MHTATVTKKFEAMGAEVKFGTLPSSRFSSGIDNRPAFTLDVKNDKSGQFFEILINPNGAAELNFTVLDERPKDRHLLLMAKRPDTRPGRHIVEKYLCGHDERFWFAAEVGRVSSVRAAKEKLKPDFVHEAQARNKVKSKKLNRHKNAAFIRQGEWFFVPAPDLRVDDWYVLKKEPLVRGRGKPHMAEFLYRGSGVTVYVCDEYPTGLTYEEYAVLLARQPEKKKLPWKTMTRDPAAYVKGRVTHPDHKTVVLPFWHRVLPNTESRAGGRKLVFLD